MCYLTLFLQNMFHLMAMLGVELLKYGLSQSLQQLIVTMTSHYVIFSIKLYLDAGDGKYIMLCKFCLTYPVSGI